MGGGPTRERGRPARMLSRCVPLSFLRCGSRPPCRRQRQGSAEAESRRRYRSSRVEEMAEAVPGLVRAGRPRSRVGFMP